MIEVHLFGQVLDAVESLMADTPELHLRAHRRGVKAWFGGEKPPREHYEAQLMARRHFDGVEGLVLEIGFHSEHKDAAANVEVLRRLEAAETKWRKPLGAEAEAGIFFGADNWRRVSEVWVEPDLEDPDLAFEVAARLVDYLVAIEPVVSTR